MENLENDKEKCSQLNMDRKREQSYKGAVRERLITESFLFFQIKVERAG